MINSRLQKLLKEKGLDNMISFLSEEITESELNTLLLHVFNKRSKDLRSKEVMKNYRENRFVIPSKIDLLENAFLELTMLQIAKEKGFRIMEFSPLAPFGTCSIHQNVHQNKVVSSTRRTEVVSDITNVMALEVAESIRQDPRVDAFNLATVHRQVRGQGFDNPKYSAHFRVMAMASSWLDKGNYHQESIYLKNHIDFYLQIFEEVYHIQKEDLVITLELSSSEYSELTQLEEKFRESYDQLQVKKNDQLDSSSGYYSLLRFGIKIKDLPYLLVDGGTVNWMQKMTQNKKRRLLISGIGTELMYKIVVNAL